MNSKHVLLIALMLMNTACAMERECALVSFKSLYGAPLISLYGGQKWLKGLSKEKQQGIRDQIESQKDDRLITFLYMVVLPREMQRYIVAHFFEGLNQEAVDLFCKIPLCDALNRYDLSMNLLQCPRAYSFVANDFPLDVIFEHAHDINVYRDIMTRWPKKCSKNELGCLGRVMDTFKDRVMQDIRCEYQFYNKYITFDKMKKQVCAELMDQILLLSSVVSAYIYLMFPFKWQWARDQGNIDYNAAADDLNKAIEIFNNKVRHLNQKPGGDYEGRSYTQGYREESLILHGLDYKICSVVFGGMSTGIFFARNNWLLQLAMKSFREKNGSQKAHAILATLFGMGSVYKVMSCIAAQFEENSFYGVGCVASLYMLLCSCYNAYKVKSLQEDSVMFKDIPQLLQRTDIEII